MSEAKHCLVVGGSSGIGLGLVHRLLAAGADVTVASRTASAEFESLPRVRHLTLDVTSETADFDFGSGLPIHGFAYCPGSINLSMLRSVKPQVLRDDFELNVVAAVRCFQAALPAMKQAGAASAVFFSTVAVAQGLPLHTPVAASKGALEALVRTWAAELAPAIRVNCIAPALTDTPLAARLLTSVEKRQAMASRYPLGRIGQVEDMAAMAEFLLSADSGWITGQTLRIDGGMSTCRS